MAALRFVTALVVCLLVASAYPPTAHAVTCGKVNREFEPCVRYLRAGGQNPPVACCGGLRTIIAAAKTSPDRKAACNCLKSAAKRIPDILPIVASNLPDACGVSIPYKISANINCSKIK